MSVITPMTILLLAGAGRRGATPVAGAALPCPPAGSWAFLQPAAEHSAAAHRAKTIERSAIRFDWCVNIVAPGWYVARDCRARAGLLILDSEIDP